MDLAWISIANPNPDSFHRLLPHGEPSIAIRRRFDGVGSLCCVDLVTCGPCSVSMLYKPRPREELIALRLKPEFSATVFGVAAPDLNNESPAQAPKTIRTACANTLKISETATALKVLDALHADLTIFASAKEITPTIESKCAAIIRRVSAPPSPRELAAHFAINERTLRRRFLTEIGVTPKQYARQVRLTRAAIASETIRRPDWAQIAVQSGYHDQPHMIHDFRAITGLTPAALHRERFGLSRNYNISDATTLHD